jgi:hypothetical protein
MACNKFNLLAAPYTTDAERKAVTNAVADLENTRIRDLMKLLSYVRVPPAVRRGEHG